MTEHTRRDFIAGSVAAGLAVVCEPMAKAWTAQNNATNEALMRADSAATDSFTRGVGLYPGNPAEYAGPTLVPAANTTRNLALLRPAYHSSSYDYNLTAQLITDGIATTQRPTWIAVSINDSVLSKQEREILVGHAPFNLTEIVGPHAKVEMHLGGGDAVASVDRLELFLVMPTSVPSAALSFRVSTSQDGHTWQQAGTAGIGTAVAPDPYPPDMVAGNHVYRPSIPLAASTAARFYRVKLLAEPSVLGRSFPSWQLGQIAFYNAQTRVEIGGPYHFTSAWKSAGLDEEWVYVDLLSVCDIDAVRLHWIAPATRGSLQTSDDAATWHDVHALKGTAPVEEIAVNTRARYLRVLMTQPASDDGYILSELEVMGRGGLIARPQPAPTQFVDGSLSLTRGNWRLQRDSLVQADGQQVSTAGFADTAWLPATVPGTTLTSYLNAAAIPDPNFGENQLYISDSFFYADFWYRTEFKTPANAHEMTWLCLDGINWKAEVFLNGQSLGRIDGAFFRGKFAIAEKLKPGALNALAIRVEKNATPGSVHQKTYEVPSKNGGGLGADNPTFHSSVGWDWIPTIRGRNTGIWNEVRLWQTAAVTVEDPLVTTLLPHKDTTAAEVTVTARVRNHGSHATEGTVTGSLGDLRFSHTVKLPAKSEQTVTFDPSNTPALRIANPMLWWPNGYGDAHLYDATLAFQPKRGTAGTPLRFKAGLRQVTFADDGHILRLFINGRRLIARGGNWGFSESMLRYRAREYDAALRYHREMNFNMVRNWVGQIGEDAFYEACDRHGIVVWQDFWLANPWDGPIPENNAMFLANARDLVKRIRNHASVGLYCGRNEGYPPAPLESGIRTILAELHPDLPYIPSSADDVVSGHGPYHTLTTIEYFQTSDIKLHSEIGAPAIPPLDSVEAMMPKSALWPLGLDYGLHDFTLTGAQGTQSLLALIDNVYGGATNAKEWIALAQFLNYDTYRAMFEAQSGSRMGVLLWMSHPCWPSFVWQTYDFYLEPTAAYFACKKACEPIHIQWNPLTNKVEVVNYNAGNQSGLQVTAQLLNPDGTAAWTKSASLDSLEDSNNAVLAMEYPGTLAPIHFCRLTLRQGERVLSTNTYLRAREADNLRSIRTLGNATVTGTTRAQRTGELWSLTTELHNDSTTPALLVRLKAVGEQDGKRILPAIYNDNYVTLLPLERRTFTTELRHADTRGQQPIIEAEGFNMPTIRLSTV